jgi:hypothetical protein
MMRPGFALGSAFFATALSAALACSAPQNGASLYQGPDRPDDEGVLGPAPPSDYNFGPIRREVDTNGDHRRDRIEFVSDGTVIGVGDDTNHDGKIDRYQKLVHGVVVEETRDTDFDGVLDLRSYDTDNDGKLDKDIQLAAPLNGEPLPVPPPKVPPPASSASKK